MLVAKKFKEMSMAIKYPTDDKYDDQAIRIKELQEELQDIIDLRKEKYHKLRREYQEKQLNLDEEFKRALFVEYGMENHRNRHNIYARAWQDGHSDGYSSVEQYFVELVELLE